MAAAADVVVFPPTLTNASPEEGAAVGTLVAQSYAAVSGRDVRDPASVGEATPAGRGLRAEELGADEYLEVSLIGLDGRFVLEVQRRDLKGRLIHRARMTLDSLGDAPASIDRIARALAEGRDEREVRSHRNVTKHEARRPSRLFAEQLVGFKLGVHLPIAPGKQVVPSLSGQLDLRFESERYFVEAAVGFIIPSKLQDWDDDDWESEWDSDYGYTDRGTGADNKLRLGGLIGEIGGSYFLTEGSASLYVGGGLRAGILSQGISVAPYAQLGVMMPRESSTRFYADLRLAQHVFPLSVERNSGRTTDYFPLELGVYSGVAW